MTPQERVVKTGTGRRPDFLVIGAPRAGTTSLFRYLQSHPDVWMPAVKELHYFDTGYAKGQAWFQAQFAGAGPTQVAGEMTPSYFDNPDAVERMAKAVPAAKLVVILRHPVDRAYSHYQMIEGRYATGISFGDLVRKEIAEGVSAVPHLHRRNLSPGRYYEHAKRLLEYFPRSSLLALVMDDLRTDPAAVYRQLCEHIGVDSTELPTNLGASYNRISPVRSKMIRRLMVRLDLPRRLSRKTNMVLDRLNRRVGEGWPPLEPELRRELLDYYAPDTDAFEDWLGRDLSAWRR